MMISQCKTCKIKIVDTRPIVQKAHDYCSECEPKAPCCEKCGQIDMTGAGGICHPCREESAKAIKKVGHYDTCELCNGFGTLWDDDDDEHDCHECGGIGDVWVEGEEQEAHANPA